MNHEVCILFGRLFRVIGVLALPADAQAACLERMGVAPLADELALEFNNQVLHLDEFMEHHLLSNEEAAALREIDQLFDSFSGQENAALWTTDALYTAREWDEVRTRARDLIWAI